jgi:hypothetical protein
LNDQAAIIVPVLAQRDDFLAVCLASAVKQTVPCKILMVTSDQTPRSNLDLILQYQDEFPSAFGAAAQLRANLQLAHSARHSSGWSANVAVGWKRH